MDSRVVLDALSPSAATFANLAQPTPRSTKPLRHSIKANFPSPKPVPSALPTENLLPITSLPALQRAIHQARIQNRPVRPSTGKLQSDSNCKHLAAGGIVLDTSPLRKLTFHPARAVIVAQAAVTLRDIDAAAAQHYFSQRVHVPLSPRSRSVAAAIATGATGAAGFAEGLLADQVLEISLVDAFGRLRVYSCTDRTGLFQAVKLSLGLFGVIYDVTIQVDRFRRLANVANHFVSLGALMARRGERAMQKLVERQHAVEIIWLPFNSYCRRQQPWTAEEDVVWVRTLDRIFERPDDKPVLPEEDDDVAFRILTIPQWLNLNTDELVKYGYNEFLPEHTKLFLGLGFEQTAWKLETRPFVQSVAHAVQYHHDADLFPIVDVSVSFPLRAGRQDDWLVVQAAWRVVLDMVKECDKRREYPLNVALKTTFVKASDALLAPNFVYGTGSMRRNSYSACVQIVSAKYTLGWHDFAKAVLREWMALPGARCQLSRKLLGVCPVDVIAASLGESLEMFKRLRRNAGVDNVGLFLDESLAELLGLSDQLSEFSSSPVSSADSGNPSAQGRELDVLLSVRSTANDRQPVATFGVERPAGKERGALAAGMGGVCALLGQLPPVPKVGYLRGGGEKGSVLQFRRRTGRRRKDGGLEAPLSGSDALLLGAYVFGYLVLWLVLFGRLAALRLGWIGE